ncbi:MAG: hypothetical protein GY757_12370 [bacterium]|nr:hypothetical protein [bacterium]
MRIPYGFYTISYKKHQAADLNEENVQILRFNKKQEKPVVISVSSIRGLKTDQVLTSEAFALPTTRNPDVADN